MTATTSPETFAPANFSDVHEGDHVQFVTANNGFDGGDAVWRTGTVTKVTAATVVVACETSILGPTAVLRRSGWNARCVSKVVTEKPATRRPYDAEHVQIVDMGRTIWALYIPDPEQAKDPRTVADNITDRRYTDVEMVATATRIYKSEGAAVSGWIIASGSCHGSEGYPNKREMHEGLRLTIADYFGLRG